MKTRKIISIMAALLMTVTVTGCNGSGELFTVSTEPPVSEVSEDESRTNEEAKGELVPKITANPSVTSNRTKDATAEDFFGDDRMYAAAPALEGEAVTNDIEFFAEAPATDTAPTAPAPDYYDDYDYDYPQTQPQAGLLTAGEWNDNDNWGFFTNLINNDKIEIPSDYGLNPTQRIAVTVRDKSENPVVNASVRGFSEGGKLVWSAVTDKNGIAYLFKGDEIANVKAESQVATAENSVKSEIKNDEQTVIKANNAEVNITLDGEGENYEKTEIMFVVDTTGSMGDELMFLQSEFTAIAEEIGTDNTKFSINFYRDDGDDYTRTLRQRKVMSILIDRLKKSDFATIMSVIYDIGPMITTNLKTSEITKLATNITTYLKYDIVSASAPDYSHFGIDFYYDNLWINGYGLECIVIYDWNSFRKRVADFVFEDVTL